jgi:hypothetical protein
MFFTLKYTIINNYEYILAQLWKPFVIQLIRRIRLKIISSGVNIPKKKRNLKSPKNKGL